MENLTLVNRPKTSNKKSSKRKLKIGVYIENRSKNILRFVSKYKCKLINKKNAWKVSQWNLIEPGEKLFLFDTEGFEFYFYIEEFSDGKIVDTWSGIYETEIDGIYYGMMRDIIPKNKNPEYRYVLRIWQ